MRLVLDADHNNQREMRRLVMSLSYFVNLFNAPGATFKSKAQGRKDFCKPSKPCHVGIHWKALAEYSQMSTLVPGFLSFSRFFASFCIG